jgi:hypothetical protein
MKLDGERISHIDWRAAVVTTLAADWTSPWTAKTYGAGTPVMAVTPGKDGRRRPLTFVSPSPEALALDLARKAAAEADACRQRVVVMPEPAPGTGFSISDEELAQLYDYFEWCFVAVTFAYEALEAFANGEIKRANPSSGFEVVRRGQRTIIQPDQMERSLSLDEKLGGLLPQLLDVSSPKGQRPWRGFRTIQAERDALLHLKADDASPRDREKQSIFHRFWSDGVAMHEANALVMIEWFYRQREAPRWLATLRQQAPS